MARFSTVRPLAVIAVLLAVGCRSAGRSAVADLCQPKQCSLSIQNNGDRIIGVRYRDAAGNGDALGSVRSGAVANFELGVRSSRTVVVEVSREGQVYRANVLVSPPPALNTLHFPSDFQAPAGR